MRFLAVIVCALAVVFGYLTFVIGLSVAYQTESVRDLMNACLLGYVVRQCEKMGDWVFKR